MTVFGFIERVIIPAVVIFLLLGGLGGAILGGALVWRSDAALRFIARMNRWVSTRQAFGVLEAPHSVATPSPRAQRWLGAFLVLGGAFAVAFLLARLHVERGGFVPGVDLRRWLVSGVTLEAVKWFLVLGSAFAIGVGALMLFLPRHLAAFEQRMNRSYSSARLAAAEETMLLPLEPRVEANPRRAGWIIAAASLAVAVTMLVLLFGKLR